MGESGSLSVCMIVRDEARRIGKALHCFQSFADEIIVVDTGSRDETKEIARGFTPNLFEFAWCDDFAAARNVSLEHAHCSHILWLDADDLVDDENINKILRLKRLLDSNIAYSLVLQDVRAGKPRHSLYQLRCVPNRSDVRFEGRIHEVLDPSAAAAGLTFARVDITITHHGYEDPSLFRAKVERNIQLINREIRAGRDDTRILYFLAQSYGYLGKSEEAVATMREVLNRLERNTLEHPFSQSSLTEQRQRITDSCLFLAEQLSAAQDQSGARRYLVKARAGAFDDRYALYQVGNLLQKIGDHEQAVAVLALALESIQNTCHLPRLPVTDANIYAQMAYSHYCLNRRATALQCIENGLRTGSSLEIWQQIAAKAMQEGRFQLAQEAYDCAEQDGELAADGYCNMGLLRSKIGDHSKARRYFEMALGKQKNHLDTLINWAHLELRLGRFMQACRLYGCAVEAGSRGLDVMLAYCATAYRTGVTDNRVIKEILEKQMVEEFGRTIPGSAAADVRVLFGLAKRIVEEKHRPGLIRWALILEKHVMGEGR